MGNDIHEMKRRGWSELLARRAAVADSLRRDPGNAQLKQWVDDCEMQEAAKRRERSQKAKETAEWQKQHPGPGRVVKGRLGNQ